MSVSIQISKFSEHSKRSKKHSTAFYLMTGLAWPKHFSIREFKILF